MEYVIKVNGMYLNFISIDNYDDELSMHFTTNIDNAKRYNARTFIKVIINSLSLLGFNEDTIEVINMGEDND